MELQRDDRTSRKLGVVGIAWGLFSILLGGVFALVAGRVHFISLITWGSGGLFLLAGVIVFLGTLRRFQIAVNESGLIVHTEGCDFEGSWDQVDAISIETVPLPTATGGALSQLVLWLPEGVPMRHRPKFPGPDGRKGYRLVEISDLVETPEQVVAALQRYAGSKFRSPAQVA